MNKPEESSRPLVLSASRSRDLVHRSPELLAGILLGEAPCRFGPHAAETRVEPEKLHSVLLWTKDLGNLLTHDRLRRALVTLVERHQVLISLSLTVTGMGGTFMEPGIPPWRNVRDDLAALLAQGWIDARAVLYRYDPFLAVRTPGGHVFSNARRAAFARICAPMLALGIVRVTTSRGDARHYPRVPERVAAAGLAWIPIEEAPAVALCHAMDEFCRSHGADFSVCCEPCAPGLRDRWGCVDGRWLNEGKGPRHAPATTVLHNRIGKQRPACRCTYSRDVGHSTGSATCFSGGYGCLYCYAQAHARLPAEAAIQAEIADYDRDPERYLRERDLPDFTRMD